MALAAVTKSQINFTLGYSFSHNPVQVISTLTNDQGNLVSLTSLANTGNRKSLDMQISLGQPLTDRLWVYLAGKASSIWPVRNSSVRFCASATQGRESTLRKSTTGPRARR